MSFTTGQKQQIVRDGEAARCFISNRLTASFCNSALVSACLSVCFSLLVSIDRMDEASLPLRFFASPSRPWRGAVRCAPVAKPGHAEGVGGLAANQSLHGAGKWMVHAPSMAHQTRHCQEGQLILWLPIATFFRPQFIPLTHINQLVPTPMCAEPVQQPESPVSRASSSLMKSARQPTDAPNGAVQRSQTSDYFLY